MIDVKSAVINIHGFSENETESIQRCLETLYSIREGEQPFETESIQRCLETLYSIREGEQPLNRGMGLNMDFLDQPVNVAKNMFALEVIEKTRAYEPHAAVEKVEFAVGGEGQLIPVIHVKRGDV